MHFLVFSVILWFIFEIQALKEVNVKIPSLVLYGEEVTLTCLYDLEGDKLYSVKWYHGPSEFYRYTADDPNPKKQFKIRGFHVVENESNSTQVVLKQVTRDISGQFSCEVTADQPSFYTIMKTADLEVVELPLGDVRVSGLKRRYRLGELIKANCTSERSYPAANITWYINGRHIEGPQVHKYRREVDENYIISTASLRMKIADNFMEGDQIKVRCAANIYHIYHRSEERLIQIERRHHHRNIKTTTTERSYPDQWHIQDYEDQYKDHTLVFEPTFNRSVSLYKTKLIHGFILVLVLVISFSCIR